MHEPQSPVDVVISIRKELKEYQQTSSSQALRETLRASCREALLQAVGRPDRVSDQAGAGHVRDEIERFVAVVVVVAVDELAERLPERNSLHVSPGGEGCFYFGSGWSQM
jgi:hypothetical protein